MSVDSLLDQIEGPSLSARLNVVSSMRSFLRAANQEPSVRALAKELFNSAEAREAVVGRIHYLSNIEVNLQYENPNDAALTILLWLTTFSSLSPGYYETAADTVRRAPQCYYAKMLAHLLLTRPKVATGDHADKAISELAVPSSSVGDQSITIPAQESWWKNFHTRDVKSRGEG